MTLYTYKDPEEGFLGFLAYSATTRPLAAGGMRVHPELTAQRIEALARTMAYKERILRVNVDGAKCGIAYDPSSPGKKAAIRRFLRYLKPHINARLSLGPDMGTSFAEIEERAREEGIVSVKAAIGRAQGLSGDQVRRRLDLLDARVGLLTLGERRAGHGVAHAALSAIRARGLASGPFTCALQGFGTLGRGAALTLDASGVAITAVADENQCVRASTGLPIAAMLRSPPGSALHRIAPGAEVVPRDAVLGVNSHVLILAACENAFAESPVEAVRAPVVVVGANGGLAHEEYERLTKRGVLTVPDIIAGCGGSAAMDALFAPTVQPSPATVLRTVAGIMDVLTTRLLAAEKPRTNPLEAALWIARLPALPVDAKPYGLRVLAAGHQRRQRIGSTSADVLKSHTQ